VTVCHDWTAGSPACAMGGRVAPNAASLAPVDLGGEGVQDDAAVDVADRGLVVAAG